MVRGWTARTAAALPVAVAILTACSAQQPASDTLPTASTASSTTAEALPPLGPADLPMPAEARIQDASGAEAFVRYYVDLINRTSSAMDAAPLREFSSQCSDCERIARDAEEDAAAGYRYEGGKLTITSMSPAFHSGATMEIGFVANQAPLKVIDANGQPVEGLTFPEYRNLQSGLLASWDSARQTWVTMTLTLG